MFAQLMYPVPMCPFPALLIPMLGVSSAHLCSVTCLPPLLHMGCVTTSQLIPSSLSASNTPKLHALSRCLKGVQPIKEDTKIV